MTDRLTVESRFTARRDSTCPSCRTPIWADMAVARLSDGAVVHDLCAVAIVEGL